MKRSSSPLLQKNGAAYAPSEFLRVPVGTPTKGFVSPYRRRQSVGAPAAEASAAVSAATASSLTSSASSSESMSSSSSVPSSIMPPAASPLKLQPQQQRQYRRGRVSSSHSLGGGGSREDAQPAAFQSPNGKRYRDSLSRPHPFVSGLARPFVASATPQSLEGSSASTGLGGGALRVVTTPVKRSQRGRVSRGAGRGESTSSSGNDTGGGGGGGGGGGSGGGSGGGVGDGGDGGGGSGRGNMVGDDDSTVFRHAGSSSADVVSGGGGGGGAGGGGGKRSSSSGSFALKERAARRVSARSSGSSSGSGCNHGEASLGAPSSHPLDSVSIGGLASSSGRGARRVSTWSNDSAGSNSREKCEAAADKRVSLLPAPQPCAGVNTSGGSGGDGAGRKGSTSTSSSSGTDRTARRVSTWSTSSGGSSGSVVMDDSVGSIGVCGGSMGGGGGDGGAGGSDSVRFHNKSGYSRSNASGVALGSSGAEYKAKDAGRMLSVSPPAGGMDRRARTAHTTGSATSNTVDSAADAENSAVETNGAPAKAPSSSVRRSAPLCIDGSVVGAASTVGKGLSLASESSLNERAAGRTGTRCSGSGGGIGGGLNVGGGRRLSTPMGGTNVCEGCRERRNAVGGGETAGALCEDCAAEAEEAPRGIKRPRQSTTVVLPRRRSSAAAAQKKGDASKVAWDGGDSERSVGIDDFEVHQKLGKGKFGIVYRAKIKHSSGSKGVALKLLSKSTLRNSSRQECVNLKREKDIQTRLSHPNIVRMVSWFQDLKWFYLVLDFASGGDVYKVLRQSKNGLPEDVAARYLLGAVRAVAYLHQNHIIHRDIKPENLLLDSRGRVKLSDFGWAVHAMPPHHHERLTMCGTPEYAAPEMLVFSPRYTNSVDVWSLGVLGYELLAGETPFVTARVASSGTGTTGSLSPRDRQETSVAAEIESVHEGDPHAKLYGRIVGWSGCQEAFFGAGTLGAGVAEGARKVVLAMLRPVAGERARCAEVLQLPWLASAGCGERDSI